MRPKLVAIAAAIALHNAGHVDEQHVAAGRHRGEHALDDVALADDHRLDGFDDAQVLVADTLDAKPERRARDRCDLLNVRGAIRIGMVLHGVVLRGRSNLVTWQRADEPAHERRAGATWCRQCERALPQPGVGIGEPAPDWLVARELVEQVEELAADRDWNRRRERLGRLAGALRLERHEAERRQRGIRTLAHRRCGLARGEHHARDHRACVSQIELTHVASGVPGRTCVRTNRFPRSNREARAGRMNSDTRATRRSARASHRV
jgi:hypothetical protein